MTKENTNMASTSTSLTAASDTQIDSKTSTDGDSSSNIQKPSTTTTTTATVPLSTSSAKSPLVPSGNDVVCGRGKATRDHPGNGRYTDLLKEHYEEYKRMPKGFKADICKRIACIIAEDGGRFLEKTSTEYVEMEHERVVSKIAQGFRDLRVAKEGRKSVEAKRARAEKKAASNEIMRPNGKKLKKKLQSLSSKYKLNNGISSLNNGPGEPRRLSFTERVKLFQEEQEKLMRRQNGDESSSEEEDEEEDEEDEDVNESENEDNDVEGDEEEDDDDVNNTKFEQPVSKPNQSYEDGGDLSETETEDSFPMYRGSPTKSNGEKKVDESDDDDNS